MNSPRFPKDGSQRRIILDSLLSTQGDWVGLNHLMRIACCGAVHSTVAELRKLGWNIQNKQHTERKEGRSVRHSAYRLLNWNN